MFRAFGKEVVLCFERPFRPPQQVGQLPPSEGLIGRWGLIAKKGHRCIENGEFFAGSRFLQTRQRDLPGVAGRFHEVFPEIPMNNMVVQLVDGVILTDGKRGILREEIQAGNGSCLIQAMECQQALGGTSHQFFVFFTHVKTQPGFILREPMVTDQPQHFTHRAFAGIMDFRLFQLQENCLQFFPRRQGIGRLQAAQNRVEPGEFRIINASE